MRLADYEDNVTHRLRDLLRSRGLDVDTQVKMGKGRADLVVDHEQGKIAVECELDGPGKKRQAVKDAVKRLTPVRHVDTAFAVVYPPKCSEKSLDDGTSLAVSIVDDYVARPKREHLALDAGGPGAPADANTRARWTTCTVAELADRIRNAHKDFGDPDTIVGRLRDAVDAAAGRLSQSECEAMGRSLGLGPRKDDWRPAARRALLIVASASMFHARLDPHLETMRPKIDSRTGARFKGAWNPEGLNACYRSADTPSRLSDAWSLLLAVDYKPIFESGVRVLDALHSAPFTQAVKIVVNWSRYAAGQVGGMRHDILGRIFHIMLDDAQFDGSYYTSVPAATLLAGLALPRAPPPERLRSFRVMDPSCGTGTLLMAAAERLRGPPGAGAGAGPGHAHLIESVLEGLDINVTALHIAATTLGLLSPTTRFGNMNLHRMPFGEIGGTSRAAAGSLELYAPGGLSPFVDWVDARSPRQIDTGAGKAPQRYDHSADLVIMNPPYTRNDKRHDQLGKAAEARVKKRESEILATSPVKLDKTSSGLMFLVLGEHLCSRTGTLACVFPLSSATAPSARDVRRFLAERFDIEYLVVSHDPDREYFSENTAIAELLLVARRKTKGDGAAGGRGRRPRRPAVVTLLENPSGAGEAAALAADIASGRPNPRAAVDAMPAGSPAAGDWSRVLFASPFLHRARGDMVAGRLFETVRLGDVADIRCGRDVRGCFDASRTPDGDARASVHGHDTSRIVSIETRPYTYLVPKEGMGERARRVWSRASHLLFPEKLRVNLAHVTAVCSPDETVGALWYSVRPRAPGAAGRLRWSKAMAAFLNSTPGIVAVLGMRIPTVLSRPRFSNAGARDVPVPRLSAGQERALAGAYDRYAARPIGLFAEPDDPVRRSIDDAVSSLLGIPGSTMARMRRELAREPMCTGRRYGG